MLTNTILKSENASALFPQNYSVLVFDFFFKLRLTHWPFLAHGSVAQANNHFARDPAVTMHNCATKRNDTTVEAHLTRVSPVKQIVRQLSGHRRHKKKEKKRRKKNFDKDLWVGG